MTSKITNISIRTKDKISMNKNTSAIRAIANSIPFAPQIWRRSKSALRHAAKVAVKFFYWTPFLSSKYVRAAFFDSAKPNTLLLSNIGNESFLVFSNDKVIGRDTFIRGTFDFDKFEKILSLLDKSFQRSVLIDIGANIGTICIPAVKRNFFDRAIAIEPEPFNYSLLQSNININGLTKKITSHNLALGADVGEELIFELSETNYGDHRIKVAKINGLNDEAMRKTIRVRSEPFDQAIGDIDPSNTLIWMDTQGFEGFVLKGAKKALQSKPPLVIEFWPYGMNRTGSYEFLKQAVTEVGYAVFYDLNLDASPTPMSAEALDQLFRRLGEEGNFTDLLIV